MNKRQIKLSSKISCLLVFLLVFFSVFASLTQAAELYLKSSQTQYAPNEIFKVGVYLNVTSGEKVTAIEGKIKYNPQDLKAIEFLTGNSILTFVDQPKIDQSNGLISFSGIIPGGYTGQLLGDPGESNLLGTIAFEILKTNNLLTTIQVASDSRVLVDAGQELKTNLVFKSLTIHINPQEVVLHPFNELETLKEADKIPPEDFKPEIIQINGQYFLVFNTQDKQSGIDHYELIILKENLLGQLTPLSNFSKVTSPYPIHENDLQQIIQIKAIDKAGNERVVLLYPLQGRIKWYQNYWLWDIILVGLLLLIYSIRKVLWKRNTK